MPHRSGPEARTCTVADLLGVAPLEWLDEPEWVQPVRSRAAATRTGMPRPARRPPAAAVTKGLRTRG